MTMTAPIDTAPAVATPGRVGQATAVEQSRAVAEVQAAVLVAQSVPRSIGVARTAMIESCQQAGLAERAFYRYPRGGQTVTGASVHLARELARCWGNVQYGIAELRRDDENGQSEMQAWAWDVQTNSRSSQTFIVPHMRDKRGGPERLTDLRDIYENNANMGARRLREAIFSILPPWFTEEAKEECGKTLEGDDDRTIEERATRAIEVFADIGVTAKMIEQKLGRKQANWTKFDLAQLTITRKSITRGEVTVDDEFPQQHVTVDEIEAPTPPVVEEQPEPDPPVEQLADDGLPAKPEFDVDPPTEAEIRAALKKKRLTMSTALKQVSAMDHKGLATIEAVAGNRNAALDLMDWIDQQ